MFFSSQKTHIIFVIVSINYSWVSQLDHRIVMSSVFDGRWKFDQIMSNQNKVFWGVGKSQGSRFGLPRFTSGLKRSFSGGLTSYFSFWFDFTPCLPAVRQPRGFSPSPGEPAPAQQFPFAIVFYHARSFSSTIIEESLPLPDWERAFVLAAVDLPPQSRPGRPRVL